MVMFMKEKQKDVVVEYGNKSLKDILSDYLIEKFIEVLNQE